MKKLALLLLLCLAATLASAQAGARDADAVLNRCGKPLKGDETVFTNAGSTRTLLYARGILHFTRVGNDGWKFLSGERKQQTHLTADQMAAFMPCVPLALADSASPEPLKKITPVDRIEVSAKHSYKLLVLITLVGLVLIGILFLVLSRRRSSDPDDE